jgi:hypothetical protein
MKNVSIIERKTGQVKATIAVDLTGLSYTPTPQEYEAAAWEAAVDDGTVNPDLYADYSLIVEDIPAPPAQPASQAK